MSKFKAPAERERQSDACVSFEDGSAFMPENCFKLHFVLLFCEQERGVCDLIGCLLTHLPGRVQKTTPD